MTKFGAARMAGQPEDWSEIDWIACDIWSRRRATGMGRTITLAAYIYFRRRGRR